MSMLILNEISLMGKVNAYSFEGYLIGKIWRLFDENAPYFFSYEGYLMGKVQTHSYEGCLL